MGVGGESGVAAERGIRDEMIKTGFRRIVCHCQGSGIAGSSGRSSAEALCNASRVLRSFSPQKYSLHFFFRSFFFLFLFCFVFFRRRGF